MWIVLLISIINLQSKIGNTFILAPSFSFIPSDNTGGVTPVPIPNTVVKPSEADGTWFKRTWESRKLLGLFLKMRPARNGEAAFFLRGGSLKLLPWMTMTKKYGSSYHNC